MTYIIVTGNLTKTPTLYHTTKGPYTYARILTTDRHRTPDGTWSDGPTIAYNLAITGHAARNLVDTATRCGNIRVTAAGNLKTTYSPNGTPQHTIYTNQLGADLATQRISITKPVPPITTQTPVGELPPPPEELLKSWD